MTESESLQKYLQIRTRMFIETLGDRNLDIVESLPQDYFFDRLILLVSRMVGQGELDIFCGYHKGEKKTSAIFLSLQPGQPLMLLGMDEVKKRIENMKHQNIPFEQSQQAINGWPN
ncbi:MAG: hypothetical protein HYX20_01815 [Candidatus Yanofskybacteria bacterium]|nr:hypothetical protein [Candidatus Yanofskybacteria bacterium]